MERILLIILISAMLSPITSKAQTNFHLTSNTNLLALGDEQQKSKLSDKFRGYQKSSDGVYFTPQFDEGWSGRKLGLLISSFVGGGLSAGAFGVGLWKYIESVQLHDDYNNETDPTRLVELRDDAMSSRKLSVILLWSSGGVFAISSVLFVLGMTLDSSPMAQAPKQETNYPDIALSPDGVLVKFRF